MTERLIIAGAGGQGIILLGKVLAEAVMRDNKHVTWLPCYGAEVRGGTAYCMVIVSDDEIGSPCIEKADTLIIMNEFSFERFKSRINNKGLLFINSSLIAADKCIKNTIRHPFTDIAVKLGNIKVANMVALGCYIAGKKIIRQENILEVIENMAPADKKSLVEINKTALRAGIDLIK